MGGDEGGLAGIFRDDLLGPGEGCRVRVHHQVQMQESETRGGEGLVKTQPVGRFASISLLTLMGGITEIFPAEVGSFDLVLIAQIVVAKADAIRHLAIQDRHARQGILPISGIRAIVSDIAQLGDKNDILRGFLVDDPLRLYAQQIGGGKLVVELGIGKRNDRERIGRQRYGGENPIEQNRGQTAVNYRAHRDGLLINQPIIDSSGNVVRPSLYGL